MIKDQPVSAVITGLGVLSPYGIGTDALASGLACGSLEQLLCRISGWPSSAGNPLHCARVRESDVAAVLDQEPRRFLNSESLMLLAAARLALADAQYPPEQIERIGIVVSTRHAGLQDYADLFWTALGQHEAQPVGRPRVSPARGPQTGLNAPAAHLSIRLGAKGPNMTLTNGAAGGIDALAYATGALESGRATTMLVGGLEVVPKVTHSLSRREGYRVTRPLPRPFDRDRSGPMLGEAGVVCVLEHVDHAQRRGARAHARVRATATAFAPDHDLQSASLRSLTSALAACSLAPQQIGAVFAAANGSLAGDAAESHALHAIFGEHTPVCAVKGATAESMGAAALVQLALAISSMQHNTIPATVGFQSSGQDIAAIRILTQPEPLPPAPLAIHAWDTMSCSATAVIDRAPKQLSPPLSNGA